MAHPDRTIRISLLALLVAAILLLVIGTGPSFAFPAANADAGAPAASAPLPFAEEEWEEDEGEWEVENGDEEREVEEEREAGGGSDGGWEVSGEDRRRETPESCMLYRASARVVVAGRGNTVRLEVSYTSDKATKVNVEYWLKGARGALQMKSLRRRMSRHGSLRGVEHLNDREMSKVRAARAFVVDLEMKGTPAYCERYCMRHLTARQRRGDRMVWSEPARQTPGY